VSAEHAEFWSTVARRYDAVVDLQIGPTTRAMVRERLAKEDALGDVVEFGCGTGFYTETLAAKARRLVATDLSPGMVAVARERVAAADVMFQVEDCQRTSFADCTFDTAFVSLVLHFTEPEVALAEMRRILRPGGRLIVANLDPLALRPLDRLRALVRIFFHGVTGYRTKPPQGFGRHVLGEQQLLDLLRASDFAVVRRERIQDTSCSSNVPIEYVVARKM